MSIEITMPRLSDTMEVGTIIKWTRKEGDAVSAGDVIADIETDKATMEMQVYDDGTMAKIVVGEGQPVDVGTVVAVLAEDGESVDEVAASLGGAAPAKKVAAAGASGDAPASIEESATAVATAPAPAAPTTAPESRPAGSPRGNGRIRVSPVARQLADDHGIDLNSIQGSGPAGRIIKRDVLQAVAATQETQSARPPSSLAPVTGPPPTGGLPATPVDMPVQGAPMDAAALQARSIPLSNMRQVIARRLIESKTTIPHYQVTVTFDMDPLLDLRKMLNEQLVEQGVKLSVNDFLIRGCALAMHQHQQFNASWAETSIEVHGEINVGIAISLPEERGGGLVVATIRHADRKSLRSISTESKFLAEKARTRGLSIEEMSDSTFTLSNLGMFGVDNFTAIINPPNSAILAVGAALEKPVVRNGELTVGHEMSATLSLDHRVIDGAMAAQYLQTLRGMLERPSTLLV